MSTQIMIAILALGGVALTTLGALIGAWLSRKSSKETTKATGQDKLIDQLQEELTRYRDDNDKRVDRLETEVRTLHEENRGYRAFIGVQRDHMAEHGVPLPPWPPHLPR